MGKNPGKMFEEDFRKSIPREWLQIRLKDAGGWSNATNTRFTISNPCDLIIFTGYTLYLLELKTSKTNTIPISDELMKQVERLEELPNLKYATKAFIVNYRNRGETYLLNSYLISTLIKQNNKSIHIDFACEYGMIIPQTKKRTRYTYYLEELI